MIKVIDTRHLRPGMYLSPENDAWVPPGARTRFGMVSKEATIQRIVRLGVKEVYIDTDKGLDAPDGRPLNGTPRAPTASGDTNAVFEPVPEADADGADPLVEMTETMLAQQEQSGVAVPGLLRSEEYAQARQVHQESLKLVGDIMARVRDGRELDFDAIELAADEIVDSIFRNENEMTCLTQIRQKDAYLLEHSLNVGVLVGLFGRFLHWDRSTIRHATVGGILHDVGKILVPEEVLNKPGRLEADEWAEMQRHVVYGYETLRQYPDINPIILSICRQHHERIDGTGYPRQLKGDAIDKYGRAAAICDVYDAITADRVYHKGMPPTVAMKRLVEWSDNHLDRAMVYQFIRCMSIYPVGSLVELDSGDAGLVVASNRVRQSRPVVRCFYSVAEQQQRRVEDVDLDRVDAGVRIVRAMDPKELPASISLHDYL